MPIATIESGLTIYDEGDGQGDSVVLVQGLDRNPDETNQAILVFLSKLTQKVHVLSFLLLPGYGCCLKCFSIDIQ